MDRSRLLGELKRVKWNLRVMARRVRQRSSFDSPPSHELPVIFGNGMAKSGSHILEQYLSGLEACAPLTFTDVHPIRTLGVDGQPRTTESVVRDLNRLRGGDIGWGYIPSRPVYRRWFDRPDVVSYFIYRDPRDRIISHIFYAMDIHKGHAMHDYYRRLESMEERVTATIQGVPGMVQDVRSAYESYLGWFDCDSVMPIRFEDLVGHQRETLGKMLGHIAAAGVPLRQEMRVILDGLIEAMAPKHSPTYRSGRSGEWRAHFTEKNVAEFKLVAGDLLRILGYEESEDWP
jgi:hypothetical protein